MEYERAREKDYAIVGANQLHAVLSQHSYSQTLENEHIEAVESEWVRNLILIYVAVGLQYEYKILTSHSFELNFLLKCLRTKLVKQFVFLVQSVVFINMYLNLWNINAFIL